MIKSKIAVITSVTGGIGYYSASFAKFLRDFAEMFFITYKQKDIVGGGANIITEPFIARRIKRPKFMIEDDSLISIHKVVNYIIKHNIDLVNIQIGTTAKQKILLYVMLLEILRRKKIPIVFTLHDVLPFENFSGNDDSQFLEVFYSLADHFILGNNQEKNILLKNFPFVKKQKISIVPHGVYNHFDQKIFDKDTAREFLEIPKNKKVILFFGFIRQYKGLMDAIEAMAKVTKKIPDTILYIAGSLKFDPDYKKYTDKIEELNLKEKIITDFAYLPEERIEALYKSSDVIILPYHRVSQSGNLGLAWSFKKPVIVTDIFPESKKIANHLGLIVPKADPTKLANSILKILQNPNLADKLGENGYQYALKKLNWSLSARKMFKIFKKVIEQR